MARFISMRATNATGSRLLIENHTWTHHRHLLRFAMNGHELRSDDGTGIPADVVADPRGRAYIGGAHAARLARVNWDSNVDTTAEPCAGRECDCCPIA